MSELYQRALRFLAARSHSRAELRRKLFRSTTSSGEAVDEVLEQLEKQGYLNDEAFAYQRALQQRHRYWGLHRIGGDLRSRGIDERIIVPVLQRVDQQIPENSNLQKTIQRQLERSGAPENLSQLKKLYDRCVRLGYPGEQVRQQLAPYFEKMEWGSGKAPKRRRRR